MASDDLDAILSQLTHELAVQNDAFFPDEQGRREADSRLAKDIVEAFNRGVATEAQGRFRAFEASSLERARGGFHVNVGVQQPPGDPRRVPSRSVTVAQVLIEPNLEAPMQTIVSVRGARAPADPWRPPPEVKYDKARKVLSDLEQTIVAARSLKGSSEPWQALPAFQFDPIGKEWVGAKQQVIAALAAVIRGWMATRGEGPSPASTVMTRDLQSAEASG